MIAEGEDVVIKSERAATIILGEVQWCINALNVAAWDCSTDMDESVRQTGSVMKKAVQDLQAAEDSLKKALLQLKAMDRKEEENAFA